MDRIKYLQDKILKARNDYYNGIPTMSDKAYDALFDELKVLDPVNIAVTMIGAAPDLSEWKKYKHEIPMGSLNKVNTPSEFSDWYKSNCDGEILFCSEKLDGLSINCVYENGILTVASTRGSGCEGEDIYRNVVKMQGIKPNMLNSNFTGSLRGEIILTKSDYKKYFPDKANARNAASGISKRLDSIGSEHLTVLLYQVIGDVDFKEESEQFEWLEQNGFKTPNYWIFKDDAAVNAHCRYYQDNRRDKLDYDIDGLVIRINDLAKQMALGDHDLRPKGAMAFKFDNACKESTIRSVIFQIGNSGRATPVAIIDPVELVGANVAKASLYNMAYIQKLGLDIGAKVLVTRANDVVPRVEELVVGTGTVLQAPTICPECGGDIELVGENLICTNSLTCPAQRSGRIFNWISELNLLEWGDSLVTRLVESGKVTTVADLYKLTVDDLASIDRMGQKSAQKCYDILWANAEITLDVFLGALSIPMIGSTSIKQIMSSGCDCLHKFGQLKAEHFELVPGVGPTKAKSLADGLVANQALILDLLANGVKIKAPIVGKLSGKSITFTGAMKNKRPVLEKMATEAGADVKASVGKGLSYLVIADVNSTSSKAVAAKKMGTKLISEEDFLDMMK